HYINTTVSILIIFMLLSLEPVFCQKSQKTDQKRQVKSQPVTAEQTQQIKKILSGYNASKLTAADAKAIQNKFRDAGIHAGPETNNAINAAGFDPEKLKTLAPPPNAENNSKSGPPTIEEKLKAVDEKISKPLSLSTIQKETVNKAFCEFYTEMDKLKKTQADAQARPDKSKVEPLKKARDAKIKKVISDEQYKKYLELEKAARPNKGEGNVRK
ncbi:MAG: hypothetical protein ACOYMF_16240, partial [Bacteroidales bacterium]